MLIIEKFKINIVHKNMTHFKKLGYDVNYGDVIIVTNHELSRNSKIRVNVICDRCGDIKNITHQEYLNQNKKHNFDTCNICKIEKMKVTNIEKYGTECSSKNENVKNKSKLTKKEKYGDCFYNNIEKTKKTNLEKYGVEYSFLNNDVKEKIKAKIIEKYGVENSFQSEDIKKIIKAKNIEKYGVENPFQSEDIKKIIKETNIKNLGVPYPTMSKLVTDKTLKTNINNGRWIKIEDREDYYNYYLSVYRETLKVKKELLYNWDGFDYYSKDYILENFNLNSNDKKYPTIYHKISIRYGFDNNMKTDEISNIKNLCITTRSNNSSKNKKTEIEFNY